MHQLFRPRDIPYIIGTAILGSLSHFLYDFSGHNPFVALISPINESVWEHLKLLFFPFLLFSFIEFYMRKPDKSAFFASQFIGVCAGMLSIVLLFYGYTSLLGRNFLLLDILIFLIGVWISYTVARRCYKPLFGVEPLIPFFAWFGMTLLFFIFTCYPPELSMFLPPS